MVCFFFFKVFKGNFYSKRTLKNQNTQGET